MLAQNFMTAADLGITEAELDALIKVLGMLERGELIDARTPKQRGKNLFHMSEWGRGCGTAACIGGYVALLTKQDQHDYVNYKHSAPLNNLYWGTTFRGAKVSQAAIALRSYLTTGEANWDEALAAG